MNLINSFCVAKDTIKKVKRQPTELEKILISTNYLTYKELTSRIYKQLQLNNKEIKTQLKRAENLSSYFFRDDIKWPIST